MFKDIRISQSHESRHQQMDTWRLLITQFSTTGCLHWQPFELNLQEDYEANQKGNGSHANWHKAVRPVNLCAEMINPWVCFGNDISSSMSTLILAQLQKHVTEEDAIPLMFMPKYNWTQERMPLSSFI